jgi:hypothetical protein
MAPPPHETRFRTFFPRGATLNIVGPDCLAEVTVLESNNIENGTSAARGSFPHAPTSRRDHPDALIGVARECPL